MPLRIRSSSSVPTTATAPIMRGMAAATSEPNTNKSRSSVKWDGELLGVHEVVLHHRVHLMERSDRIHRP